MKCGEVNTGRPLPPCEGNAVALVRMIIDGHRAPGQLACCDKCLAEMIEAARVASAKHRRSVEIETEPAPLGRQS